jgi:hypothetical protein
VQEIFTSNPFLCLATADGLGMAYLNGLVGHHGKNGCRLFFTVPGHHKQGGTHYYPALLKPVNYIVKGSDPDIDIISFLYIQFRTMKKNLNMLFNRDWNLKAKHFHGTKPKPSS